MTTITFR